MLVVGKPERGAGPQSAPSLQASHPNDPSAGENIMQATVIMLIALSGLGCQNPNPVNDLAPMPSVTSDSSRPIPASVPSYNAAPTAYTAYTGGPGTFVEASDDLSFGECARKTFCSFFIGRDPDVPGAREIEAAYYAGLYSR
jgi:hypothetical protein